MVLLLVDDNLLYEGEDVHVLSSFIDTKAKFDLNWFELEKVNCPKTETENDQASRLNVYQ